MIESMSSCRKLLLVIAFGSLLPVPSALADEADAFNVNASIRATSDNNLFRLSPSVDPKTYGLDGKSDTITTTAIDFRLDRLFSRQRIVAGVTLSDNRYQRNDYLNFRALNYDAKWLWALGSHWDGELSLARKEGLNTFSDYLNYRQRNVRTTEDERFTANYWFHTSWAALGGVFWTNVTNEQPFLAESDYSGMGYNFGIRYRPVSGNTLTFGVSRLDGEYKNRQLNIASQIDKRFYEDVYGLDMNWGLTGKSLLRGRLAYLDRQHESFTKRDYSGWVGNLDYSYIASGKSTLTVGYKRDIVAYQQLTSSYYTLDEIALSGQWAATAKLTAIARLAYGLRSYDGEIRPLPAGTPQREDIISRLGFDLRYQPARWLQLSTGIALENRNVNQDSLDYKDRIGFISATAQY